MLPYFLFNAAVLLPFLSALSVASPLSRRSIAGPVIKDNFPDPSVIQVGSTYYAFATNNGVQHIPYASSPDFKSWTVAAGRDALPRVGAWSNGKDVWAPDVVQVVRHRYKMPGSLFQAGLTARHVCYTDSEFHAPSKLTYPQRQNPTRFVMYYTARTADGATLCVGAAVSSTVEGPYSPLPDTLGACPRRYVPHIKHGTHRKHIAYPPNQ